MAEPANENFEFVKKFSYRTYQGKRTGRLSRIFSLASFEMINTWRKSTIGKILLGLALFLNVFVAVIVVSLISMANFTNKTEFVHNMVFRYVTDYLSVFTSSIVPSNDLGSLISLNLGIMGILIIGLLAIAGSGFFADDKQGKVIELYLSRMRREDYAIGKILGMFFYCNLFITIPMLILSIWLVQGLGQNQVDYIGIYSGIVIAGAIISFIFTIFTLILSSLLDKRAYASLSFFIGNFLYDLLSRSFYASDPSNQFLLLVVPTYVISLLIFVMGGQFSVYVSNPNSGSLEPLLLNNGVGLEWWHVLLVVFLVILIGMSFLLFKIHRMTTNEL